MVAPAIHHPFASPLQSQRTSRAVGGCRVVRCAASTTTTTLDTSRPLPLPPPLGLPPHTRPSPSLACSHRPPACDSDSSVPRPDASAATKTTALALVRCARLPRSAARTDGGFPHSLSGPEIAARLETRQAAGSLLIAKPLFWRDLCASCCPYHCQKCTRPHRERDVPIPACPRAHFVVVHPHLAFAGLDAFFHRPSFASHLHMRHHTGVSGRKHRIGRHITRIREAAPKQQPAPPASLGWRVQEQLLPLVHARSFRARTGAQAHPVLLWQFRQHLGDRALLHADPDILVARASQYIGLLVLFQPASQVVIVTIDAIASDVGQLQTSLSGAL